MGAVDAPESTDKPAPLPRGPRFLGMSGGTLLTAAFVMPVAQVCDKPDYPFTWGPEWGGLVPEYLFGLLVAGALASIALGNAGHLKAIANALRVYVVLWAALRLVQFAWGIIGELSRGHVIPWTNYMSVVYPVSIWLAWAAPPNAQRLGRTFWIGGILWAPLIAMGFDHGIDNLLYGFWVMLAGVTAIAASGIWIERAATGPPGELQA